MTDKLTKRELLARIEALEARCAALESRRLYLVPRPWSERPQQNPCDHRIVTFGSVSE